MRYLLLTFLLVSGIFQAFSQCSSLRQQRNITFNTDKDCAPVTVTDFTITYFFNTPQDPLNVVIRFEWNDPTNAVDNYAVGDPEFSNNAANTEFTAVGTFTYPENDDCVFQPVSSVVFQGELCETSQQEQVVTSWARDNDFGGAIEIDPGAYDVCYNNTVNSVVFEDNSTFNCNVNQEPDNPNRIARHTQFVYGTNHNAGNSIRNLTMVDDNGATIDLTDNAANLSANINRSGVGAAYFGPILEIPFPADEPQLVSFPVSAPADVDNAVGSQFEITLYNWNICNPYNGNENAPNYDDASLATAFIRIVNPPVADFQARSGGVGGAVQTVFCLTDQIYFENLSTGATAYSWEIYDDTTATNLLTTLTANNPTYSFSNPGYKLIRLYASNANVAGNCVEEKDLIINLSPAAIAAFGVYDAGFVGNIDGVFCGNGTDSIEVGFRDQTVNVEPETEWRWEFYGVDGILAESIPDGNGNFGGQLADFTRTFTTQGIYEVKLIARNSVTRCESVSADSIIVYDTPEVFFEAAATCAGTPTLFHNISDSLLSLAPRVLGDYVSQYEWDFSYDGNSFNAELLRQNSDDFEFFLDGQDITSAIPITSLSGNYQVALRMTTQEGKCSGIFVNNVTVNPQPNPLIGSNYTEPICPNSIITFQNLSNLAEASYFLIVTDSLAVYDTLAFDTSEMEYLFQNTTDSTKTYYTWLRGITPENCSANSSPQIIEVFPGFQSGFFDANYSTISGNCSVWESTFQVNTATRNLNPDQYTWTISNVSGVLAGYPITKTSGDTSFHQLAYQLTNVTNANQVFTVVLVAEKADVCIASSTFQLVITPQPASDFDLVVVDSCEYKIINLEANQPGLTAYRWAFAPDPDQRIDDGASQRLTYLRPAFAASDIDLVFELTTENITGCISDTSLNSVLLEKLEDEIIASFTVEEDTIMLPDSIITISNQSGAGWQYSWDFGDGDQFTGFEPGTHNYSEPGAYQIQLTVKGTYCQEFVAQNIVVEPANPVIDFVADVLAGCNPLTVSFDNQSQYADPSTYFWEFGDNKTSRAENPTHTYGRSGTYTVRLYGENRVGTGNELIRTDYIEVYPQPVASFALNPQTTYIPDQEVYFRNSSADAISYLWDFGDGEGSEEENPTHIYTEVGAYDVTLIALSEQSCADTLVINSAVEALQGGNVATPNAFSPGGSGGGSGASGGDAINDTFIPRVEGAEEFRMLIYNKWGQLLYETRDLNQGWDGNFQGQMQPSDVYVYRLELKYSDGREVVRVGDVTLLR